MFISLLLTALLATAIDPIDLYLEAPYGSDVGLVGTGAEAGIKFIFSDLVPPDEQGTPLLTIVENDMDCVLEELSLEHVLDVKDSDHKLNIYSYTIATSPHRPQASCRIEVMSQYSFLSYKRIQFLIDSTGPRNGNPREPRK